MEKKLTVKSVRFMCALGISLISLMLFQVNVFAKERTIPGGVTIGDIDISGMTEQEALNKANEYIASYTNQNIELDVDGNKVTYTVGELGYYWKNPEIVSQAAAFCEEGNVIVRYKESKDIEKEGLHYDFEVDVNDEVLKNAITDKCGKYNTPHKNAQLTRTGNTFSITQESAGRMIDMDTSVANIHDYLINQWDGSAPAIQVLPMVVDNPVATVEDCQRVKDLLGSYSTTFSTSSGNYNRNKNMENGIKLLNGITLCQGETMSVNSFLEPWTEDNGWYEGGTYVNGRVENSLGGGICQVSTTLYNAVLNAELEVVERFNHSMSVGYVPLSMDAALAGTWKDLKIKNNTDTPIYIEGIYTSGKLTFNIYGEETRPSNRRVEYVSETLGTIPSSEVVKQDPSKPAGYRVVTESGHTGYRARLWKKVYVDGALVSEEVINNSSYSASPTYVTVGTGAAEQPTTPTDPTQQPADPTQQQPTDPTQQQPTDPVQQQPADPVQQPADPVQQPADPVQQPADPVQQQPADPVQQQPANTSQQ